MYSIYDPTTLTQAFALSRQGSSHRRAESEKPCQDSCGVLTSSFRGEGVVAVVAADGHGSAAHDRSDLGSQLAVQAAGAVFMDFVVRLSGESKVRLSAEFRDNFPKEVPNGRLASEFRDNFPKMVVRRWRELVGVYSREAPIAAGDAPDRQEGEELWKRYGTTLLFAGVYRGYLFLAQLGDGAVIIQRADGRLQTPMPEDASHFGGHTHSLCAADARQHTHVELVAAQSVQAVLLCTDGVTDAFDDRAKMLKMVGSILENRRQYGLGPSTNLLPEFLDRASTFGSGDDMTVAGLVFHATEAAAIRDPEPSPVVPDPVEVLELEVVEVVEVVEVAPEPVKEPEVAPPHVNRRITSQLVTGESILPWRKRHGME